MSDPKAPRQLTVYKSYPIGESITFDDVVGVEVKENDNLKILFKGWPHAFMKADTYSWYRFHEKGAPEPSWSRTDKS